MVDLKFIFDYMTKTDYINFWNYLNIELFKFFVFYFKILIIYI